MKSLKTLFIEELTSSMLFLFLATLLAAGAVMAGRELSLMKQDSKIVELFASEATKNALAIEQPIMIQRSINEFWTAFIQQKMSIRGIRLYLDQNLVAEAGSNEDASLNRFTMRECTNSSGHKICVSQTVSLVGAFYDTLIMVFTLTSIFVLIFAYRRKQAASTVELLTQQLETQVDRITSFFEVNQSMGSPSLSGENSLRIDTPILDVARLGEAYDNLIKQAQKYFELEKAKAVSDSLHTIAAKVSHDIRSPISALKLVVKSLPDLDPDKKILIENVAKRITEIADDLLDGDRRTFGASTLDIIYSTPISPAFSQRLELQSINKILREMHLELLSAFDEKKNIKLILDLSHVDASAFIDVNEFSRVISNLCNNSGESIEGDGIVRIASRVSAQEICVLIEDSGVGINPDLLAQLGKQRIRSEKPGGTGIGIWNARRSIEAMNGKFLIQSKRGLGTLITIQFKSHSTKS